MTELRLSSGDIALIDDGDLHVQREVDLGRGLFWRGTIASVTWHSTKKNHTTYVVCSIGGGTQLRLHRVVMNATASELVDHRNGNGLDCQRLNLRITDAVGNSRNRRKGQEICTSRFKGVSFHKAARKWSAQIKANGVKHYLGLFSVEEEAAAAYDAAAKQLHGEFARPNAV